MIFEDLAYRTVQKADFPFLRSVYASTREHEMSLLTHWSHEDKEEFLKHQFDSQHSHYQKYFGDAVYDIIVLAGIPVGRLYLREKEDEILIIDIALLPGYRRRGIGRFILKGILKNALEKQKPVRIHVEKNNPALTLYTNLGFKEIEDKGVYFFMEKTYESNI